ncbi:DNA polymerase epsilon subunit 3-like [Arctopsyche grandis]|uniref:DNA polymerase epsilon subunit 3-like n=1 Tax=Arctopsyche grandis TaxID=121162 RepID=UPI00406D7A7A
MAEKLEDLNLPLTVVSRIIKDALPAGVSVTKEARIGLAKVASVFVLYVTSASTNVAKKAGRRTLVGQDVLDAMEDIEFEKFVEHLRDCLETYKVSVKHKKDQVAAKKKDDDNQTESLTESLDMDE